MPPVQHRRQLVKKGKEMKALINLAIVLLFNSVSAQEGEVVASSLNDCLLIAADYGDGQGHDVIPTICQNFVEQAALPSTRAQDDVYKVYGFKSLIFIERQLDDGRISKSALAGEFTTLKEIKALSIDNFNNEVAVYDAGDKKVKYFSLIITGNVAPFRELQTEKIENITSIAVNPKNGLIVLHKSQEGEVLVYSREGNIHAPQERRFIGLLAHKNGLPAGISSLSFEGDDLKTLVIHNGQESKRFPLP